MLIGRFSLRGITVKRASEKVTVFGLSVEGVEEAASADLSEQQNVVQPRALLDPYIVNLQEMLIHFLKGELYLQ